MPGTKLTTDERLEEDPKLVRVVSVGPTPYAVAHDGAPREYAHTVYRGGKVYSIVKGNDGKWHEVLQ